MRIALLAHCYYVPCYILVLFTRKIDLTGLTAPAPVRVITDLDQSLHPSHVKVNHLVCKSACSEMSLSLESKTSANVGNHSVRIYTNLKPGGT
jgi:hypothetical protein